MQEPHPHRVCPLVVDETKVRKEVDPFHHRSRINIHNHHDLHPWGPDVTAGAKFHSLYAEANNQYMFHVWYNDALAPFMAAEIIAIHRLPKHILRVLTSIIHRTLGFGIDAAMASSEGKKLTGHVQTVLDDASLTHKDQIFVRLGATSAKDSWAALEDVPTMKPPPLTPNAELILRRLLTSARVVGRLLALSEGFSAADPGEALVIQRWCADIECRREFRVFCYRGRVTAVSQDIWWEKLDQNEKYSVGFVDAIVGLWNSIKTLIPFNTCTMDVLMTQDAKKWNAAIIEFNGFGAHLNTGSDLFHWVHDAHILQGETDGITLRFIEDNEDNCSGADGVQTVTKIFEDTVLQEPPIDEAFVPSQPSAEKQTAPPEESLRDDSKPDWLALEEKLRSKFGGLEAGDKEERLKLSGGTKIPLRGRWSSAY